MSPLHTTDTSSPLGSSQTTPNGGGGTSDPAASDNNISGIDSTQSPEKPTNNTVSAAADSSDNQPATPQPHLNASNSDATLTSPTHHHHHQQRNAYANHQIYGNHQQTTATSAPALTTNANHPHLNQLYAHHSYSPTHMDLPQHQQQQQQPLTSAQHSGYPSYLNSYEQFYQQQQQHQNSAQSSSSQEQNPQQMDFINSNTNSIFPSTPPAVDYNKHSRVRFHPYLHHPTSAIPALNTQNSNSSHNMDTSAPTTPVVSAASSSMMSPRIVSSTSPSSSSNQMQMGCSTSSIGSMSAGNPSSPNTAGSPQCKKCGTMCANEAELQEHITNVHGASPYGSSGYASSPYIKEEMQQQTPPAQNQQQQLTSASQQQTAAQGNVNPGEILDLDSQKMLYPPAAGPLPTMLQGNLANNTDPLHGLHSMQQRAGMNTWDQQAQEGLPSYMQQQQQQPPNPETKNIQAPFYQSPKQSPYDVSNSCNIIKTEFPTIIKTEYTGDNQQFMADKSFDPTAPNQQQQMMPPALSSSPAEFPSTTTPQDNPQQNAAANNQQFRGANFEPPSSSSANVPAGNLGTKAANWKSNEARRPKTYNCTACNKWFTSSGHLKRHYNTTLHKNAVKSSGQPDPASLPISAHHHPARDASGKTGRGRGSSAAANNAQKQQQPAHPVQPPEPPNSPPDYGEGSQVAALTHYSNTSSPNSMYSQDQQYQYMSQVPTTVNNDAPPMGSHNLHQQNQQPQTVSNGHPNALAGPSVSTIQQQQQMPMPSSPMRGLLNTPTTMPSSMAATTTIRIAKVEHLEAAAMAKLHPVDEQEAQAQPQQVAELDCLSKVEVKQEHLEEMQEDTRKVEECQAQVEQLQATQALRVVDHSVEPHPNNTAYPPIQYFQLETVPPQEGMECLYPNTIANNSPLIISPHQYQEQQQQQHQMVAQGTYTQLQQPNTTDQVSLNMPLAIATQLQPNNMLQLQQSLITTEQQQLPPATTIRTTNMANMQQLSHHHMQPLQQQLTELQPLANMQQQLDTINTNIPLRITPTPTPINNITNTPSYHQMQQPASVLQQLDPTLNYHPTIIGNTEFLTMDAYGNLFTSTAQSVLQTSELQYLQFITTAPPCSSSSSSSSSLNSSNNSYTPNSTNTSYDTYMAPPNKSPTQGDLPPVAKNYQQEASNTETKTQSTLQDIDLLPSSSSTKTKTTIKAELETEESAYSKRGKKKLLPPIEYVGAESIQLPNGRLKCIPCNKTYSKKCYLTQHNNCFHSGTYPYRCTVCGKRFKEQEKYEIHFNIHKKAEKDYKCGQCNKQYFHVGDLRRHIKCAHKNGKDNICHICKKGFGRNDHLLKHIETHFRQRPAVKKTIIRAKANKKSATSSSASSSNFQFQNESHAANNGSLSDTEIMEFQDQVFVSGEGYMKMSQYEQTLPYRVDKYEIFEVEDQEMHEF